MALISFFKTPKPKQFNYIPRYYDQRKEEMEERKKRIAQELGLDNNSNNYITNIKGKMRHIYQLKKNESRKSNFRILIILIFLMLLLYLMFFKL
jgi:(p)ppGpp synthase/HD superfamily hydrolase